MWDKRVVGQSVTLKRNPYYWQKGKPYLDSVTWTYVSDENTRELQLRGGQIQVDEFPPFNSIDKLQNTPGVDDDAVPVDADRLPRDERELSAARRRARAPRDLVRDRPAAIVKSVLFGYGKPANSFLPPQVPFYDANAPRHPVRHREGEGRAREVEVPERVQGELLVGAGAQVENAIGQILQQALKQLGINVTFKQEDTSTEFQTSRRASTSSAFSYWTMDIADPDELVTFAVDPKRAARSSFSPATTTRR